MFAVYNSHPPISVRVVSYLVPTLFLLFQAQCAHTLKPFYHPLYAYITHMRLCIRFSVLHAT